MIMDKQFDFKQPGTGGVIIPVKPFHSPPITGIHSMMPLTPEIGETLHPPFILHLPVSVLRRLATLGRPRWDLGSLGIVAPRSFKYSTVGRNINRLLDQWMSRLDVLVNEAGQKKKLWYVHQ